MFPTLVPVRRSVCWNWSGRLPLIATAAYRHKHWANDRTAPAVMRARAGLANFSKR